MWNKLALKNVILSYFIKVCPSIDFRQSHDIYHKTCTFEKVLIVMHIHKIKCTIYNFKKN